MIFAICKLGRSSNIVVEDNKEEDIFPCLLFLLVDDFFAGGFFVFSMTVSEAERDDADNVVEASGQDTFTPSTTIKYECDQRAERIKNLNPLEDIWSSDNSEGRLCEARSPEEYEHFHMGIILDLLPEAQIEQAEYFLFAVSIGIIATTFVFGIQMLYA